MHLLVFVTILWAFSVSLIGELLLGVDSYFSACFRVALAALLFLPFTRWALLREDPRFCLKLAGIGAVQLGLMYVFYFKSFTLLSVPEVLVFTVLTPLYVTLLNDWMKGRFSPWFFLTALLAVLGAAIVRWSAISGDFILGFFIVQGANICFAFGQIAYKQLLSGTSARLPVHCFGFFHLGAFLVTLGAFLAFGSPHLPASGLQWAVLFWLGLGASGVGYLLWNHGATRVDPGALAAMNNALVPAGLLVNLTVWNADTDVSALLRLGVGSALIVVSLIFNEKISRGRERLINGEVSS